MAKVSIQTLINTSVSCKVKDEIGFRDYQTVLENLKDERTHFFLGNSEMKIKIRPAQFWIPLPCLSNPLSISENIFETKSNLKADDSDISTGPIFCSFCTRNPEFKIHILSRKLSMHKDITWIQLNVTLMYDWNKGNTFWGFGLKIIKSTLITACK